MKISFFLNKLYPGTFCDAYLVTDDHCSREVLETSVRFRGVQTKKQAKVKLIRERLVEGVQYGQVNMVWAVGRIADRS